MTITAKFAGTCRICQGPIKPGSKIEWEKGKGSSHAECVGKSPVPLNSPPPAAIISADTDLSAAAAKHGRTLAGEPKIIHLDSRVSRGEHCAAIGSIEEYRGKRLLVLARTKPVYLSADYLEDMDMCGRHPGLWYEMSCVEVAPTATEAAKDSAAQSAKDKATADQARRDAIEHQVQAIANLNDAPFPDGLQDCWGYRAMAGHRVLMSDGVGVVLVSESSYDDSPWSWLVRDAALAAEALALRQPLKRR